MGKINNVDNFFKAAKPKIIANAPHHLREYFAQFPQENQRIATMSFFLNNSSFDAKKKLIDNLLGSEPAPEDVNVLMYFFAVASSEDFPECFQYIMEKYGQKVDFDSSFGASKKDELDPYAQHQNNIIKCLLFQENYYSLKVMLGYAISKGIKPKELHKDKDGKTDLAALIINQSPPQIIDLYLQFSGLEQEPGKIDFFEKQGEYSLLEYILYLGNKDILAKFADEIKRQLENNPHHQKQIDDFHNKNPEEVLKIANQIFRNNGMTYAIDPLQTIQPNPPLKNPTDRALGFDYILRASIQSYFNMMQSNPGYSSLALPIGQIVQNLNNNNSNGRYDLERRGEIYPQLSSLEQIMQRAHPQGKLGAGFLYPQEIRQMTRGEYILAGVDQCQKLLPKSRESFFDDAIKAVRNSNLAELQKLVMNNPWLTTYENKDGNRLLHFCTNGFEITKKSLGLTRDDQSTKNAVLKVLSERSSIAEFLILNGADIEAKNIGKDGKEGETAIDILKRIADSQQQKHNPNNKKFAEDLMESINSLIMIKFIADFDRASKILQGAAELAADAVENPFKNLPSVIFRTISNLIIKSDIETLKPLLEKHHSWLKELRDENGNSLLHICAADYRATASAFKGQEATFSIEDAFVKRADVMKLFLDKGFDINYVNKDGENLQKKLTKMTRQEFGDSQNMAQNLLKELSKYIPASSPENGAASKLRAQELQL